MITRLACAGRLLAMLLGWSVLCAASSPVELMPAEGRARPFGKNAQVVLVPASEVDNSDFGERPKLDEEGSFEWRLSWNGEAYDVVFEGEQYADEPEGTLAFMKLKGTRHLYAARFWDPGSEGPPEQIEEQYQYFLMWRLSRREFIGYLNLFWLSDCGDVSRDELALLGLTDEDIENCSVHSWQQVEGVLRAYARTKPRALGVMRGK